MTFFRRPPTASKIPPVKNRPGLGENRRQPTPRKRGRLPHRRRARASGHRNPPYSVGFGRLIRDVRPPLAHSAKRAVLVAAKAKTRYG